MSDTTLRPLSIGEILDGSFTLYRRHFAVFFSTAMIILLPAIPIAFMDFQIANLFHSALNITMVIAAIWQMSEAALGRRPGIKGAIAMGLRKFFPVVGAGIAIFFLIFLGFLLLIVPGILIWIMLFAVLPVVVLEGNFKYCIGRSRALAKGSWGKIFIVYLVSTIIAALPGIALAIGIGYYLNKPGIAPIYLSISFLLQVLVQALVTPFSMGIQVLLYYDQRVRKEGLDVELSAAGLEDLSPQASAGCAPAQG